MMKNFFAAMAGVAMLAGCAGAINLPIVGKISNGETAQGTVSIDLATRKGNLTIVTLSGLQCAGTYDASDTMNTITIPVTCNNGQTGVVIATRDATGVAGTATARLKNGMSGRFLFGNVSAQMQADFLK